jgi:SAM-dependent methyltransferase
VLKPGASCRESESCLDCLDEALRSKYNIVPTANVSENRYDPIALAIIDECREGLVLDCGAGKQATYYDNVVNFEIVAYDTTDVLGVAEELPFADESFDAVLSLNVLEHVSNPFACASEIARVLKPGGKLYCVVPFLQPVHAYPHHYFNMTREGLRTLFDGRLEIDRQQVLLSGLPIWTLTWFLRSWLEGLDGDPRREFGELRVADLVGNPLDFLDKPWVTGLSQEKNFELASTTALMARKPAR